MLYYQRMRRQGGPAMQGMFSQNVQNKMSLMTKLDRTQLRTIDHLVSDPTLATDDPEMLAALQRYQEVHKWGFPAEKEQANFDLFQTLKKAGQKGLAGLVWVARNIERHQRLGMTFLSGSLENMAFDVEAAQSGLAPDRMDAVRQVLTLYDDDPDRARREYGKLSDKERSVVDVVPEGHRAAAGMTPWERIKKGWNLEPGSLNLRSGLYVPDDGGGLRLRMLGVKETMGYGPYMPGSSHGVAKFAYEMGVEVFDPIVWLTGSGSAAVKLGTTGAVKALGKGGIRGLGRGLAKGTITKAPGAPVKVPVYLRGQKDKMVSKVFPERTFYERTGGRRRDKVLSREGLEEHAKIYAQVEGAAYRHRLRYLKTMEMPGGGRGYTFPGRHNQTQRLQEEARSWARERAEDEAAKRVGQMIDDLGPSGYGLLDKGGSTGRPHSSSPSSSPRTPSSPRRPRVPIGYWPPSLRR